MANHKRKRPKNRRAGCLMCKPHKANNAKQNGMRSKDTASVRRKLQLLPDELVEEYGSELEDSGADQDSTEESEE